VDLGRIGTRLTQLREAHGVSATALAEKIGISRSYLSRLENGHQIPSISVLDAIADSFDVELEYFFATASGGRVVIDRNVGDAAGVIPKGATFAYEAICRQRGRKLIHPVMAIFAPRSWTSVANHDVEYFRYIIEGSFTLHYSGQSYAVDAGDAIYYDATIAHQVECTSAVPCRALTLFAKPTPLSEPRFGHAVLEEQL